MHKHTCILARSASHNRHTPTNIHLFGHIHILSQASSHKGTHPQIHTNSDTQSWSLTTTHRLTAVHKCTSVQSHTHSQSHLHSLLSTLTHNHTLPPTPSISPPSVSGTHIATKAMHTYTLNCSYMEWLTCTHSCVHGAVTHTLTHSVPNQPHSQLQVFPLSQRH